MGISFIRIVPTLVDGERVEFDFCPNTQRLTATLLDAFNKRSSIRSETLPKSLKIIRSHLEFNALLNRSYVRASHLSDGDVLIDVIKKVVGGAGDLDAPEIIPEKVFSLVRAGMATLASTRVEDEVILVSGKTGCGKSVLGNLLAGATLYGKELGLDNMVYGVRDPIFSVSDSNIESCTGCPGLFTPKFKNHTFIDYPGYDDTHGPVQDIANAFFRKAVLKDAKSLKIVLVVNYDTIKDGVREVDLRETFEELFQFLGFSEDSDLDKLESLANSIVLVVSKVPSAEEGLAKNEVERLLRNFLAENSSLTDLAQSILRLVLDAGQWSIFSRPSTDGSSPKILAEKITIQRIINGAQPIEKSATDLQVKVNKKYRGDVQTYLQAFIHTLNTKIGTKITNEISNFFTPLLMTMIGENALQELQRVYQRAIEARNNKKIYNFLKGLQFSPGLFVNSLLAEGKVVDDTIIFFRELIPKEAADEIPHERNWIDELGIATQLTSWNTHLSTLLAPATVLSNGNILIVQGGFPKVSQIKNGLTLYDGITVILVLALHTVTFNEDLVGVKMQRVNVVIFAPVWIVERNREIDLRGKDADVIDPKKAADGRDDHEADRAQGANGSAGEHGNPGLPGTNGSHFAGVGGQFINLEGLTVKLSGGKGGPGQHGGNGRNGIRGADGAAKNDLGDAGVENAIAKGCFNNGVTDELRAQTGWKIFEVPVKHNDNNYYSWCINLGQDGGKGGDAGRGGAAGIGGASGTFNFFSPPQDKGKIKFKAEKGGDGAPANNGTVGLGAVHGSNWKGLAHFARTLTTPPVFALLLGAPPIPKHTYSFKWENVPQAENRTGKAADGTPATVKNEIGRITPIAESFDLRVHLTSYHDYVTRVNNPLISGWIEAFRLKYRGYPGLE